MEKKTIPDDIEITPIFVVNWYLGDGTLSGVGKNKNRSYKYRSYKSITLATNCFTREKVESLVEKMKKAIGLKGPRVYLTKLNQVEIRISKKEDVKAFFEYLPPCVLDCFSYKFEWRVECPK
jgi:hypothetical protein